MSLVGSYELLPWLVRTAAAGAAASEPAGDLSLSACWAAGPGRFGAHRTHRVSGNEGVGWSMANGAGTIAEDRVEDINVAALAAYHTSIDTRQATVGAQAGRPVRQDIAALGTAVWPRPVRLACSPPPMPGRRTTGDAGAQAHRLVVVPDVSHRSCRQRRRNRVPGSVPQMMGLDRPYVADASDAGRDQTGLNGSTRRSVLVS
jgi:hypothetical protein